VKKLIAVVLAILIGTAGLVYYQKPITIWAYDWSHILLGGLYNDTTGTPLKVDSEGQVYVTLEGMSLLYTGTGRGGVSQIVSTVSPLTTANLAFGLIQLTHGSPGLHRLPDGSAGQEITIELLADPAYILGDIPMTRTGWDTITFNSVRDRVTLTWLDDTYGWIITNNDGCAITY